MRVTPRPGADMRALLAPFTFDAPMSPEAALEFAIAALREHQTHTPHPRYYGLFNPAPTTMGIFADALVAAFNPQLAAWSKNPFAIETEAHLLRAFGRLFGFEADGTFCSGGAEANHTAVLAALVRAFPEYAKSGTRARPTLYVSSEAHHSFLKAARLSGIGEEAVREVETDDRQRMRPDALDGNIRADRAAGRTPFLVVATAGTTATGAIDPIPETDLWLHVDAAWGGAAMLLPELRPHFAGIERADSVTFDAHKWLSVPMGAGMFLTRHRDILDRTFRTSAGYMPPESGGHDPYNHSMQWSRRFIGLKLFLSLAVAGWDGYARAVRHMVEMGDLLRSELRPPWRVVNSTPLPLVCFAGGDVEAVVRRLIAEGLAWVSSVTVRGVPAVRACVTNYRTGPEEVRALAQSARA
jgi:glutamate/tyrosine decarboxylase-like PLP-dependent enzyme